MMESNPDPVVKYKSPIWMRALLVVSLGLNLAVAGMVVGTMVRFGGPPNQARPPLPITGAILYRELPSEIRKEMRSVLRGQPPEFRRAQRREVTELMGLLRADPVDQSAVMELMQAGEGRRSAFQRQVMENWVENVAEMTVQQRNDYADRVLEALENRPRRGPKDKDKR